MKKIALFFALLPWAALAQTTKLPHVERQSANYIKIVKVEITDQYTIVNMEYGDKNATERKLSPVEQLRRELEERLFGKQTSITTIGIDPASKLVVNQKGNIHSYRFIKSENIPVRPEARKVKENQFVAFRVFYERLEPGEERFDFMECRSSDAWQCWNFYGVNINNPAKKQKRNLTPPPVPNAPVQAQRTTEPQALVLLSGQVFDARTRESIEAKIYIESPRKDSLATIGSTGVFRRQLPPATYRLRVLAKGYIPLDEQITLTDDPIERDFYLNSTAQPIEPKEPTPVETPKPAPAEPATKIEEMTVAVGEKINLKNILFETGKATLLTESRVDLDGLVRWMTAHPTVEIRLEGHTDTSGEPEQNQRLSVERVVSVKRYLLQKGIAPERIATQGFGDTRPLTTGRSEAERRINRRVELVITKTGE